MVKLRRWERWESGEVGKVEKVGRWCGNKVGGLWFYSRVGNAS